MEVDIGNQIPTLAEWCKTISHVKHNARNQIPRLAKSQSRPCDDMYIMIDMQRAST